jgi:hypothetical protein
MSYIRHLPKEMIHAKYQEYKNLYEKFERLYTSMRSSRSQFNMTEVEYYRKLRYYSNMSDMHKKQMNECRMFLINRNA